jgi:hypothetical protein
VLEAESRDQRADSRQQTAKELTTDIKRTASSKEEECLYEEGVNRDGVGVLEAEIKEQTANTRQQAARGRSACSKRVSTGMVSACLKRTAGSRNPIYIHEYIYIY